jgi:hypothetical protein
VQREGRDASQISLIKPTWTIEAFQTRFMWIELKVIEAIEGNLQHQ